MKVSWRESKVKIGAEKKRNESVIDDKRRDKIVGKNRVEKSMTPHMS
jgi:hypothetical protein